MPGVPLRIGLIGAGSVARQFHIPGWMSIPEAALIAIADIDESAASGMAERAGITHVFADFRDLLRLDLDAVDVCTPNRLHFPMVMAALDAGRHVLCEKPLSTASAEVRQMGELAERKGLKLMTGHHYRFGPAAQAVKKWALEGNLGRVYHARARAMRRATLPPQPGFIDSRLSGGGACMDIGVHALDLALWLMGFPDPVRVSGTAKVNFAKGGRIRGAWGEWDRDLFSVEDFAAGLVHFRDGATLTLETAWLGHQVEVEDLGCQIFGLDGGVKWPSAEYANAVEGYPRQGILDFTPGVENPHTSVLRAFLECIMEDEPSPVPWLESWKSIAILESIYRSAALGHEVEVPPGTAW
jgi:predicted dehydrogenase